MLVVAAVYDCAGYSEQPVAQCVYKNCILIRSQTEDGRNDRALTCIAETADKRSIDWSSKERSSTATLAISEMMNFAPSTCGYTSSNYK